MKKIIIILLFTLVVISTVNAVEPGGIYTICSTIDDQLNIDGPIITATPDLAGNIIIFWQDSRASRDAIYGQKISSIGSTYWQQEGVLICSETSGSQQTPRSISDNADGAILTWRDNRFTRNFIYSQRINKNGITQWDPKGVCVSSTGYSYPAAVSLNYDGDPMFFWSGMTISTQSTRQDIYSKKLDIVSGIPAWEDDKIVCSAPGFQWSGPTIPLVPIPILALDSSILVVWTDTRQGLTSAFDVYSQSVDKDGNSQWEDDGVFLTTISTNIQVPLQLLSDNQGGAYAIIQKYRDGFLVLRETSRGEILWKKWNTELINVSYDSINVGRSQAVLDQTNSLIIPITIYKNSTSFIYIQKVDPNGNVSTWGMGGKLLIADTAKIEYPKMLSSQDGTMMIIWRSDNMPFSKSSGNISIYGMEIDQNGVVISVPKELSRSNKPTPQAIPELISDGQGGAVILWIGMEAVLPSQSYKLKNITATSFSYLIKQGIRRSIPTYVKDKDWKMFEQ